MGSAYGELLGLDYFGSVRLAGVVDVTSRGFGLQFDLN